MAFRDRIELLIDVVTGGSTGQISKLKSELAATDGAFNKVKVGAKGFGDVFKFAAVGGIAAAGAGLTAFAGKAVGDFQKVALGAGELRDSLGLTAEEASRFQEVAGDLGIGVEAIETSLGRMNRAAATTPEAFAKIGAAIAQNADGTTNVQQTFLNVVDALNKIPDATARAAAAQSIFGRGWQSMAELIEQGADGVAQALASVENAKVMDDGQIERARQFRDLMDDIRGRVETAALAIGGTLSDAFLGAQQAAEGLAEVADDLWPDDINPFPEVGDVEGKVVDLTERFRELKREMGRTGFGGVDPGFDEMATGAQLTVDQVRELNHYTGELSSTYRTGFPGDPGFEFMRSGAESASDLLTRLDEHIRRVGDTYRTGFDSPGFEVLEEEALAVARAAREADEALQEMFDTTRAGSDAGFALRDAQRDLIEQLAQYDELVKGGEASMTDLAQAQDDVSRSAIEVADNVVRVAEANAQANGSTVSAIDGQRQWAQSMLESAATASGPVRDAISAHTAAILGIPPEAVTNVQASGAPAAEQALHLVRIAVEGLPADTPVWVSAPGAVESAAALSGVTNAANTIPPSKSTTTMTPTAVASAAALTGVTDAANTIPPAKSTSTATPTAGSAMAALSGVSSAANSIPPSKHTNTTISDGVTGKVAAIIGALDRIPATKTVTIRTVGGVGGGGGVFYSSTGGQVPGSGEGDTVPAMLEPGEFVVRKDAARKLGLDALHRINQGLVARFASGGPVLYEDDRRIPSRSPAGTRPGDFNSRQGQTYAGGWSWTLQGWKLNGKTWTGGSASSNPDPYNWQGIAALLKKTGGTAQDPYNWRGIAANMAKSGRSSSSTSSSSGGSGRTASVGTPTGNIYVTVKSYLDGKEIAAHTTTEVRREMSNEAIAGARH